MSPQAPMKDLIHFAGGLALLTRQFFKELFQKPRYPGLILSQIYFIGVQSFTLVAVLGLAVGSVMALQFGYGVQRFGGVLYVPKVTALAILREMGPVFTSLLIAGRVGSGIAAEVASMKVTQQIDAIRALGTSPIKKIVIPRVIACVLCLPLLTLFSNVLCLSAAMLVLKTEFNIGFGFFWTKVFETVQMGDLITGLIKTAVFAWFISMTACWKGLNTEGGTRGVGDTTTWVVVTSSIFIMISDFFLTKLFIYFVYPRH